MARQTKDSATKTSTSRKRSSAAAVAENVAADETPKSATPPAAKTDAKAKPAARLIAYTRDPKKGDPPAVVKIGMKTIELPDVDAQREGFEHEHAALIVRALPGYKFVKGKGEK